MGLALSASWNAFRHSSGEKMLFEIQELGFTQVELSFNLTAAMVEEILALQRKIKSGIKVVSVHNYCPIPERLEREAALPDCYSMSSADEEERSLAVGYTKKTIDSAVSLGASTVILHCGRVEIPDRTKDMVLLYRKGLRGSQGFLDLRDAMIKEREASCKPFLENALRSLSELNRYAGQKNINLGVETRVYFREIPSYQEIGIILSEFKGSNIFYWHDTGHAQLMEELEFARHKDFLDSYSKAMLGIHLHDIADCQDHLPPSDGKLDFNQFTAYLDKKTIKVIEAHHPATGKEIQRSKIFLEGVFNGIL